MSKPLYFEGDFSLTIEPVADADLIEAEIARDLQAVLACAIVETLDKHPFFKLQSAGRLKIKGAAPYNYEDLEI